MGLDTDHDSEHTLCDLLSDNLISNKAEARASEFSKPPILLASFLSGTPYQLVMKFRSSTE